MDTTGKPDCQIFQFPERAKAPSEFDRLKAFADALSSDGLVSSSILSDVTCSSAFTASSTMFIKPCINVHTRGAQVVRVDIDGNNTLDFDFLLKRVAEETTDPRLVRLLEAVRARFKASDDDLIRTTNLCPEVEPE
jgi:hypothetical protein